jgi:hypothetical protein
MRYPSSGFYVAVAAAISTDAAPGDDELILRIEVRSVPKGFAQYVMVDAVTKLDESKKITPDRRQSLIDWMERLPDLDDTLKKRIAKFKSVTNS